MTDSTKSAVQVLKELKKERDELTAVIQALERRLGISAIDAGSENDEQEEQREEPSSVSSIPIGFFHNLSQAAAAEKLLKLNPGEALKTPDILDAFRASGMNLNPRNAVTILYTALKRSPKFERVGKKAWGLKEWYPERRKKITKEEEGSDAEEGA